MAAGGSGWQQVAAGGIHEQTYMHSLSRTVARDVLNHPKALTWSRRSLTSPLPLPPPPLSLSLSLSLQATTHFKEALGMATVAAMRSPLRSIFASAAAQIFAH